MSQSYYETAEGVKITQKRALQELAKHGITRFESEGFGDSISEFYADLGNQDEYSAQAVLLWLGY